MKGGATLPFQLRQHTVGFGIMDLWEGVDALILTPQSLRWLNVCVRVITIIDSAPITIIDGSFRARSQYRWPLLSSLGSGDGILPDLSE